jgi:allantoicase
MANMSATATGTAAALPDLLHQHESFVSAVADLDKSLVQQESQEQQQPTTTMIPPRPNYLSASLGARILFATDEWFAAADNLLQDTDAVFDPNAFCNEGKVMDGWETRRRRTVGHDFCLVQLATPVQIDEIVIDTGYFTGNFVPAVSIQAHTFPTLDDSVVFVQQVPGALARLVNNHGGSTASTYQGTAATTVEIAIAEAATTAWETIVPVTPLRAGYDETRYHTIYPNNTAVSSQFLRINIYPDGGMARIRVYGRPVAPPIRLPRCLYPPHLPYAVPHGSRTNEETTTATTRLLPSQTMNSGAGGSSSSASSIVLTELTLGGQGIDCSNQHYGSPVKLLQASFGKDMGDGWETARQLHRPHRLVALQQSGAAEAEADQLVDFGDLRDWCIVSLGTPAQTIHAIIVDTKHFRGNYPESVMIEGRNTTTTTNHDNDDDDDEEWTILVPRSRLAPDAEHLFQVVVDLDDQQQQRPTRDIRVTIFPDGGISRVRVYGEPLLVE